MIDWLVEPYSTIGTGKNKKYKFKNSREIISQEEFEKRIKSSIKSEDEVKPKAKQTNRKNKNTEPTTD